MRTKFLTTLFLLAIMLMSMACGPVSNVSRQGATLNINLTEQRVDSLLNRANMTVDTGRGDQAFLDEITEVDFRDGTIYVEGMYTDANGETRTGSMDIEMSATDGLLNVRLANVQVEGVSEAQLERLNEELATEFASEAEQGDVEFVNVTVTDDELQMEIRVNFQ